MQYKNDSVGTIILRTLKAFLVSYILMILLLSWCGVYNFVYQEHMHTFYFDSLRVMTIFEQPGGFCKLLGYLMTQYFVSATAALLITAAWLALVATFTIRVIWSRNHSWASTPLGLLPAFSLVYLLYNINFTYSGIIAYALMMMPLSFIVRRDGSLRYSSPVTRLLFVGVTTVLLYALAGAVAMLFAVMVFVIKLFFKPKMAPYYLAGPVLALILGWFSVRGGVVSDMWHAITPEAYFTARLDAPALVYSPWWVLVVVTILTFGWSRFVKTPTAKKIAFLATSVIVIVSTILTARHLIVPETELFKELNCYIRNAQWQKVIERTQDMPLNNLLLQNCRNLALAEQGQLADSLFCKPCYDIRSIYITGDSKPHIYMLLSDIYYSMGHIALAQRHAFEALESLNNVSPRMLQRLVETNMIYGNYGVAERYLTRLAQTRMYKDWANEMRAKLNDEAVLADPVLGPKRRCLDADDRFSALHGLDSDLLAVVRANPEHANTVQYLGSLYLLTKDLPRFMQVVDEFYGTPVLPTLPQAFAEGVLVAAPSENPDSIIDHYGIKPETIDRMHRFMHNPADEKDTFWYFLKYVN